MYNNIYTEMPSSARLVWIGLCIKQEAVLTALLGPQSLVLGPLLFLFLKFIYNIIHTEMASSARLVWIGLCIK